jgi:cytochrome d ubiquinol oxidase subunit II
MFDFLFDYAVLKVIMWCLLGALFWGFTVMDGFDLGVATLLPVVGKTDLERRTLINTVGPFWEGNQVWLILGAGFIFGAWPTLYAVLFSGLYLPFALLLFSLILRPVGFKFRSKVKNMAWRSFWDACLFISGLVPAFCFGAVLGVMLIGLHFYFTPDLQLFVGSNLSRLLKPISLCSGALWVTLFIQQGALFLSMKVETKLQERLQKLLPLTCGLIILFLGMLLVYWHNTTFQYHVISVYDGPANPFLKVVGRYTPRPIQTFYDLLPLEGPLFWPFLIFGGCNLFCYILSRSRFPYLAFILHSLQMGGVIALMGWLNYPLLVPSLTNPSHSLTIWDSSSSAHSLRLVLIAVIIFMPIIIAYTIWVHRVLFGRVREKDVQKKSGELY